MGYRPISAEYEGSIDAGVDVKLGDQTETGPIGLKIRHRRSTPRCDDYELSPWFNTMRVAGPETLVLGRAHRPGACAKYAPRIFPEVLSLSHSDPSVSAYEDVDILKQHLCKNDVKVALS